MDTIGRYRLLREVARGGMGAVYRAEDPAGRPAAVKLLLAGADASEQQRRRFTREVQALLLLRHPQVVQLLDAGLERGTPWLAMEWIEGESLEARLAREGALDPTDAAELVAKLARALAHCHAQGIVHRDLKPANVLLRHDGEPLVTDFGLVSEAEADGRSRLTRSGAFLGTPGYWSPEQARGEVERIGPQSDVWGLGALLVALLTGEPPMRANNLAEALGAFDRPLHLPRSSRPGVPRALDAVCRRCLALAPDERYPGADALAEDLERWLAGKPPLVATRGAGWRVGALLLVAAPLAAGAAFLTRGSAPPTPTIAAPAVPTAAPAPPTSRAPSEEEALLARLDRLLKEPPSSDEALAQMRRLEQLRPNDARVQAGIAGVHYARNELELALAAAERAVGLAPRLPGVYRSRSAVRTRLKDLRGARADVLRALALEPVDASGWAHLSAVLGEEGDLDGANRALDWALALAPDDPHALINRAGLRFQLHDLAGAERDITRVLELDPSNVDGWNALVALRGQRGDLPGALEAAEQAVLLGPSSANAWAKRGAVRTRLGDRAGGLEDYLHAVELDPRDDQHRLSAASALARLGRRDEAIALLEGYLNLVPEGPGPARIRQMLADLRARAGRR